MIDSFQGDYSFLSNFAFCKNEVEYDGDRYPTAEHAYQAAKTLDWKVRMIFLKLTSAQAKRLGRNLQQRKDWESIKFNVMKEILRSKFTRNLEFKQKLIDTKDQELVEGNTWGDKVWGACNGEGLNMLGKLLMEIRNEFSAGKGA